MRVRVTWNGEREDFVEEGEAIVTKRQIPEGDVERQVQVGHLKKGDYFGGEAARPFPCVLSPVLIVRHAELSLLRLEPRAATVSAIERPDASRPKLKVAALDAHAFTRLLGPLREIMERNAGQAYGPRMR